MKKNELIPYWEGNEQVLPEPFLKALSDVGVSKIAVRTESNFTPYASLSSSGVSIGLTRTKKTEYYVEL